MIYNMRDISWLACTLGVALTAACGDNGGTPATETDATTGTPGTGTDPTNVTDTVPGTTEPSPTTEDAPTTQPGPTTGDTSTTEPVVTTDPTTEGSDTDSTTEEPPPVCPYTPVDGMPSVGLVEIAAGFDRPVLTLPHPDEPDRLFVVEQGGHIKILEPGETTAPPDSDDFLFVEVKNANAQEIGAEQGLLGLAFHPNFPTDPRVYINYNAQDGDGRTLVEEYQLDANNPDKVDPGSARLVYAVGQPASNHNGGMLAFGADGMLYIGMGDGGGANDQFNTARDPKSPHAKILRIDVEPDGAPDSNKACGQCPSVDGFDFTVPADNPHVDDDAYAPEVYAMGLRNPWRFAIDPATQTMYAADVGQGTHEEVSVIQAGGDYGWSDMEGNHCFQGAPCDTSAGPNGVNADGLTAPISEYSHGQGRCSITGAFVYHSCEVPAWDGVYFYADYCSGDVFALKWDGDTVEEMDVVVKVADDERVVGSGYNGHGDVILNVVVVSGLNTLEDGKLYRVVPGA